MAAKKKAAPAAPAEEPKTPETPVVPEAAAPAPAKPVEKAKSTDPITVKFRDHEGKPQERVFSKEVHGDNFAAIAEEFKATNADRLIA